MRLRSRLPVITVAAVVLVMGGCAAAVPSRTPAAASTARPSASPSVAVSPAPTPSQTPEPTAFEPPSFAPGAKLLSVYFATEQAGWLGTNGSILRTTDGGASWKTTWTGDRQAISFVAVDSLHVWAVLWPHEAADVPSDELLASADGGASWRSIKANRKVRSIAVTDATHGWATAPVANGDAT